MMILQHAVTTAHPLAGTAAQWMWMLPLLPLLGFIINGALSIFGAAQIGPRDPSDEHGAHGTAGSEAHDAAAISHAEQAGAHGDDHHAVKRHRFASIVSIVGPGVLLASFVLALMIFRAMTGAEIHEPFIQKYFSWMPVGDLNIDAAFQLDQLSMLMVQHRVHAG
jgi:NADH-quinone oxidoreductase subunit L